jgi:hypothetical protein
LNILSENSYTYIFKSLMICRRSRDSLVGIATGYGLDDKGEREFESR